MIQRNILVEKQISLSWSPTVSTNYIFFIIFIVNNPACCFLADIAATIMKFIKEAKNMILSKASHGNSCSGMSNDTLHVCLHINIECWLDEWLSKKIFQLEYICTSNIQWQFSWTYEHSFYYSDRSVHLISHIYWKHSMNIHHDIPWSAVTVQLKAICAGEWQHIAHSAYSAEVLSWKMKKCHG